LSVIFQVQIFYCIVLDCVVGTRVNAAETSQSRLLKTIPANLRAARHCDTNRLHTACVAWRHCVWSSNGTEYQPL